MYPTMMGAGAAPVLTETIRSIRALGGCACRDAAVIRVRG